MSQYLKNPDVATVRSKTRSTDPKGRSRECPGRQCGADGPDDTIADDTDSSAQCDISIHSTTSPEAPQMTYSPPAVASQNLTTPPLSAITTHPLNLPTVYSDIGNPATPNVIAAGGSRDPPVPNANHPGETINKLGEGPSPIQSNEIDSTGGTTRRRGKARRGRYGKKR